MANNRDKNWLIDDVATFLASSPSHEELLAYRPSPQAQARYESLIGRSKAGVLNTDEEWELAQFELLEMLMQSVKARLRTRRAHASVPA